MPSTISTGLITLAATMLWVAPAFAGLDVKTRTTGSGADADSSRMRTQGHQLRIDAATPPSGQGATSMVFDAKAEVLRILRHGERTYLEIDREFAAGLAAKMAEAQRLMEAQLAKMPPDQRAMMEKMMKSGALPFPKPGETKKRAPLEAKATGESETVNGTPCTVYALRRAGELKGDVCVASWDAIGITPSDVEVVKKLGTFQGRMTEAFAGSMPGAEQPFELLDRVDGFPLRTRRTEAGKVVSETFFEDIVKTDVPADTFEIPAGYTKKEMGLPGGE